MTEKSAHPKFCRYKDHMLRKNSLKKCYKIKAKILGFFKNNEIQKPRCKLNKSSTVSRKRLEIQLVITCSKLTIETLEQGMKYVQS